MLTITKMRSFKTRGIFSVGEGGRGGGEGVLIKRTIKEASTSIMAYCLKASVPQVTRHIAACSVSTLDQPLHACNHSYN